MSRAIKQQYVGVHQLAAVLNFKEQHTQQEVDAVKQLLHDDPQEYSSSHLCHQMLCSAEGHVVLELHTYNLSRQGCQLEAVCNACSCVVNICNHEPRCLQKGN